MMECLPYAEIQMEYYANEEGIEFLSRHDNHHYNLCWHEVSEILEAEKEIDNPNLVVCTVEATSTTHEDCITPFILSAFSELLKEIMTITYLKGEGFDTCFASVYAPDEEIEPS